ncbi:MAG TPA: GNAT family N-acetyltransferase [Allosphingosinicella sp.]|jgi:predicted GNAT family acetyltransferase
MAEGEVTNNEELSQYELTVDGKTAIAAYRRHADHVNFYHTEVPAALEGQGIGKRLVAAALADVRRHGHKIVATCPFVRHYIETHPEEQDLLLA